MASLAVPFTKWWGALASFFRLLFWFSLLFFCGWLLWKSLTPALPDRNAPLRFYSNQCRQDLTLTFLEAIRSAKSSIDLAIFGLSDPAILQELERKAKEGVPTKVSYDFSGSPNLSAQLPSCELHPIFQSGLMHQKILIIDDALVFLGSANMTPQSLQMHDNLVLGLYHPQIASFLKMRASHTAGHMRSLIGGQEIDLWLLPDLKGEALTKLRTRLQQARSSIRAALFTFTHPLLLKDLLAAHKRGVEVTVVMDMHSGVGASSKIVAALRKAGIEVLFNQGVQLLHHKFVYIDGESFFTGSANWTQAAFAKNNDCLLMLPYLTEEQKKYLNFLWKRLAITAKKPQNQILDGS